MAATPLYFGGARYMTMAYLFMGATVVLYPAPYEAAELAGYLMWSCTVEAEGRLNRPGILMSKNWMTHVWSWDHCFNALALAPGLTNLALDQLLAPFDHQDASGALPDSITHSEVLRNYVKPPIHGWALRRFIKATLLLSGAAILLIGLGKKLGWIELDWASIESHVRDSFAWLQGQTGAIKQFVTGYLPSAGAAGTRAGPAKRAARRLNSSIRPRVTFP